MDTGVSKTVSVSNNPMEQLIIQPWTENKTVISVDPVSTETTDFDHMTKTFLNASEAQVTVVLEEKGTGIDEHQHHALEIFPNPVYDIVRIESPSEYVKQVRITDGSGRLFYNNTSVDRENIVLDLEYLPAGMYICQLFFDHRNLSKKFIKL